MTDVAEGGRVQTKSLSNRQEFERVRRRSPHIAFVEISNHADDHGWQPGEEKEEKEETTDELQEEEVKRMAFTEFVQVADACLEDRRFVMTSEIERRRFRRYLRWSLPFSIL